MTASMWESGAERPAGLLEEFTRFVHMRSMQATMLPRLQESRWMNRQ